MNSDRTIILSTQLMLVCVFIKKTEKTHAQRITLNILVPFLKSSLKQLLRRMTSHESIVSTHSFTHIVSATWEKGTNKRHNGLLREFIGESLKKLEFQDLKKYIDAINLRPRCILDYQSPNEAFHNELIQSRTAQKIVIGYEISTSTNKERKKYTRLQRKQHNPKITASPLVRGSRS